MIRAKTKEKYQNFSAENISTFKAQNLCTLHGHVFVMVKNDRNGSLSQEYDTCLYKTLQ